MVNAFRRSALDQPEVTGLKLLRRKRVIIKIKTTRKAPGTVEHKRADHRASRVSIALQRLRQRLEFRIEWLAGEILHAVLKRIGSCYDRRDRKSTRLNSSHIPLSR